MTPSLCGVVTVMAGNALAQCIPMASKLDLEPDENVDEVNWEPPTPRIEALAAALDQREWIQVHDVVVQLQ